MEKFETIILLGKELDVYGDRDSPLFLAVDVAKIIDYSVGKTGQMLETVDDTENLLRKTVYTKFYFNRENLSPNNLKRVLNEYSVKSAWAHINHHLLSRNLLARYLIIV